MAVANTLSQQITDLDAGKKVTLFKNHGRLRFKTGTVVVAAADDDLSTYRLVRLNPGEKILQAWLYNDAITGGSDFDFGTYKIAADGGAVVSATAFGSGISLTAARTTSPIDIAWELRNISLIESSAGAASARDLVLTANTVGSGAGDIALILFYTDGS